MIKQKNFLYNSLSIYTNNVIYLNKSRKNSMANNGILDKTDKKGGI